MVHVDNVPRGKGSGCVCPRCKVPLVAKRGNERVHHFAHDPGTLGGCGGEGQLHTTAKRLLFDRIQKALSESAPIDIQWECRKEGCHCFHKGNLLKEADDVLMEKSIPWKASTTIRPDIYLSSKGKPNQLIEIVDSHSPAYPLRRSVVQLIFHVKEVEDLDRTVRAPVLKPEIKRKGEFNWCRCAPCSYCPHPSCDDYHRSCTICRTCVEGDIDDHAHCANCRIIMQTVRYPTCSCCYVARRFGLPVCQDRDASRVIHGHCKDCGRRVTHENWLTGTVTGLVRCVQCSSIESDVNDVQTHINSDVIHRGSPNRSSTSCGLEIDESMELTMKGDHTCTRC